CFSSLKKIFIGGAACPPHFVSLFHEKMPGAEIYNMYGPTEVTVYCMFHKFKQNELEQGLKKVPLGKSFPNHFIQLVDHDKKSTNNKGELVVYGPQVMKGYWGDKNTTDNVFITDSKYQFKGYLTGDIVKKEKDNIFFVGRTNETIKTSGYRVDTSEIESAIMNCEPVKDVAVISKPDTLLENILFAFIMLKDGYEMNEADIKNTISKNIPSYMIPKKIINIEQFPLNPSGKTDKRELKKMLNNFL
ncbi:Long chain acyl-CoA synthetase, partial [Candidatus Magnetomorum sp. HK-1]